MGRGIFTNHEDFTTVMKKATEDFWKSDLQGRPGPDDPVARQTPAPTPMLLLLKAEKAQLQPHQHQRVLLLQQTVPQHRQRAQQPPEVRCPALGLHPQPQRKLPRFSPLNLGWGSCVLI